MDDIQEQLESVDYFLDILDEGKKTSYNKITKDTKVKRAIGQLSSIEARNKKDPLYDKMVKYKELYLKYRDMIHKKYASRVRSKARR